MITLNSVMGRRLFLLLFFILNFNLDYGQQKKITADDQKIKELTKSGLAKIKQKDFLGAMKDFSTAIAADPGNWKLHRYKGDSEIGLNKYDDAILSYTKTLSLNTNDTASYKGRAEAYRQTEQWEKAIRDYNVSIQLDSQDAVTYFGRGACLYVIQDYDLAIKDFNASLRIWPRVATIYLHRGYAYLKKDLYTKAVTDFTRYFKLGGKDINALLERGLAYTALSDERKIFIDSAMMDFSKYLEKRQDNPVLYRYFGIAYHARSDTANSRKMFKKSLELSPNNPETLFRWGNMELQIGDSHKALELLNGTLSHQNNPSSALFLKIGQAKILVKDTVGANESLSKAIKLDSTNIELYRIRASLCFLDRKRKDQVVSDIKSMIRFSYDTLEKAYGYSLISMVEMRTSETSNAIKSINTAIRLVPYEPVFYLVRAIINFSAKMSTEEVLKDIDKSIRIDPTNGDAYLLKATFYAKIKEHKKGCKELETAILHAVKVNKEMSDYICKGRIPKNGKEPDLFFPLMPRLRIDYGFKKD
jgi:tetratricopeptide (TPR) repeat protein